MKKIISLFILVILLIGGCEDVAESLGSGSYRFSITIDGTTHSFSFNSPVGDYNDSYTDYNSANDWYTEYEVWGGYNGYNDFYADIGIDAGYPYIYIEVDRGAEDYYIEADAWYGDSIVVSHTLSGNTLSGTFSGTAEKDGGPSTVTVSGSFYISDITAW